MAEQPAAEKPARFGWFKTIIGVAAGLLSGALMTYFTPLVDKLVKPPKPLANFHTDQQGLKVIFFNRSTGGVEGWWDFGDGSALQPVELEQSTTSHTYDKPGNYTAKLSLRNYIGEEGERAVAVQLSAPTNDELAITEFTALPMSPEPYAPATYRLVTRVTNADLCVFDFGSKHSMKVVTDLVSSPDQTITFKTPGNHTIKVLAVKGKKTVERRQVVSVKEMPRGMARATWTGAYQATWVDKLSVTDTVSVLFPPQVKSNVSAIDRIIPARPGFVITGYELRPLNNRGAQNVKLVPGKDPTSIRLTGQLVKTSLNFRVSPPPSLTVQVVTTQERRTPKTIPLDPLSAGFTMPGTAALTLPKLPAGWVDIKLDIKLRVEYENSLVWEGSARSSPAGAVRVGTSDWKLISTVSGDQGRVELVRIR